MGTEEGGGQAPEAGLQFDSVEHAAPEAARACARCTRQITDEYYEIGGQVLCPGCAGEIRGGEGGAKPFLRALALGGGAALLGTIVWYLIVKITDYELGLIAVAVGLLIGFAVRKGSRGRGGWKYQLLAVGLTYASITASKVPFIVDAIRVQSAKRAADASSPEAGAAQAATGAPAPATATAPEGADNKPVTAGELFFGLAFLFGVALASPFLAGTSNIIGILIIGIALYEAWKMNRRVPVSGPFRLGATPVT